MATGNKGPSRRHQHWQTAKPELWRRLYPEAQRMRRTPTPAEALLWARLRGRALGVRFRWQHTIDRFIVDFCCLEAKLVVEVDGAIHERQQARDAQRSERLGELGFRVLRFPNAEVEERMERVLAAIQDAL